jgi:4'-phosphopantetheinyl transferase
VSDEASEQAARRETTDNVAPVIRIWFAPPEAADALDPATLDARRQEEWSGLRTERRRRDWRAGRALQIAADVPAAATISLSHSAGQAALVIGPAGSALGVDLESMAPRPYADLAELAFAPAESAWLRRIEDPQVLCAAFYELWTLKEACIKALQLDLLDGLRHCRFIDDDGEWRGSLPVHQPWSATVYAPRPRMRLAWIWIGRPGDTVAPDVTLHAWPGQVDDWPVVRCLGTLDSRAGRAC